MKKVLVIVILVVVGYFAFSFLGKKDDKTSTTSNNHAEDYKIIETVSKAVDKIVHSQNIASFSNQAQWYVFDLRLIYSKEEGFYKALKNELGENFNTMLSTGDYIFVGVLPTYQKYKIYAGDPNNDSNMIYPEWKYTKLEKK